MRTIRLRAGVVAAVLVLAACGSEDEPAAEEVATEDVAAPADEPAVDDEETAEPAAPEPPDDGGDFDADAWCALADAGLIMLRYDDPDLLAEHIERLEQMAALTSGEVRAHHDAGVALRREVLAVVEDLVEPGMDEMERRDAVDGHERITALTQAPDVMASEAALMGLHLDHCL